MSTPTSRPAPDFRLSSREVQRHSDDVVRKILGMLERGELNEGDVLPPERNLAQQFNVGRNTLREAIKVLQVYGVVERSPRLGTIVRRANLDHILGVGFSSMQITTETFDDIQQFRQLMETGIAPMVVERCTPAVLDSLADSNSAMAQATDLRDQAAHDYRFHETLLELTGNAVLVRTYRVLGEPIRRLMELGKGTRGKQAAFEQHQAMIAALGARDTDAYRSLLIEHLAHGRRYLASPQE